jgi:hypothetical protein
VRNLLVSAVGVKAGRGHDTAPLPSVAQRLKLFGAGGGTLSLPKLRKHAAEQLQVTCNTKVNRACARLVARTRLGEPAWRAFMVVTGRCVAAPQRALEKTELLPLKTSTGMAMRALCEPVPDAPGLRPRGCRRLALETWEMACGVLELLGATLRRGGRILTCGCLPRYATSCLCCACRRIDRCTPRAGCVSFSFVFST